MLSNLKVLNAGLGNTKFADADVFAGAKSGVGGEDARAGGGGVLMPPASE